MAAIYREGLPMAAQERSDEPEERRRRVGWAIVIPVLWLGTGAALGFGTAYLTTQTKAAWQVVKANEEADKARQTADAAAIRAAKALLNEADIVDSARRSMQIIAVGRTSAITREGWVAQNGKPQRRVTQGAATIASYAADGDTFMVAEGNKIYVGHADTLDMQEYLTETPILSAAFMPDGHRVIVTDEHGTVSIVEGFTGTATAIFKTNTPGINRADVSPDGHLVAAASADKRILLWRFPGMSFLKSISVNNDILSLSFSANNNNKLLVRFQNGASYCFNLTTGTAEDVFVGPLYENAIANAEFPR
jgi:hypothetical protein